MLGSVFLHIILKYSKCQRKIEDLELTFRKWKLMETKNKSIERKTRKLIKDRKDTFLLLIFELYLSVLMRWDFF